MYCIQNRSGLEFRARRARGESYQRSPFGRLANSNTFVCKDPSVLLFLFNFYSNFTVFLAANLRLQRSHLISDVP